jgi:sulfatase maturation enzyme AslB (radical SAM superfamily)
MKPVVYDLKPKNSDPTKSYAEKVRALAERYPTVCVVPFVQLCTSNDGRAIMCNRSINPDVATKEDWINENSVSTLMNREFMVRARQQKLGGQKLEACKRCYTEEAAGLISKRMRENFRFWDASLPAMREAYHNEGRLSETLPIYLDLKLGNLCNLACAYCGPTLSTSLMSDQQRMRDAESISDWMDVDLFTAEKYQTRMKYPEDPQFWEKMEQLIPSLKMVFFEGGEPTIQKPVKAFLQQMIDAGVSTKVDIKLSTNMTMLNSEWLEMLSKFKEVSLFCSIDGLKGVQEMVRYGSDFETVGGNFEMALKKAPASIKIHLLPAISVLNAERFVELLRWKEEVDVTNRAEIGINPIITPEALCIRILPRALKIKLQDDLNAFLQTSKSVTWQKELAREIKGVIDLMWRPLHEEIRAKKELGRMLAGMDVVRPGMGYVKKYGHIAEIRRESAAHV